MVRPIYCLHGTNKNAAIWYTNLDGTKWHVHALAIFTDYLSESIAWSLNPRLFNHQLCLNHPTISTNMSARTIAWLFPGINVAFTRDLERNISLSPFSISLKMNKHDDSKLYSLAITTVTAMSIISSEIVLFQYWDNENITVFFLSATFMWVYKLYKTNLWNK